MPDHCDENRSNGKAEVTAGGTRPTQDAYATAGADTAAVENGHGVRNLKRPTRIPNDCQATLTALEQAGRKEADLVAFIGRNATITMGSERRSQLHAWATGKALLALRDLVAHGNSKRTGAEWEQYIQQKLHIYRRTARRWMNLAREIPTFDELVEILEDRSAKRQPVKASGSSSGSPRSSAPGAQGGENGEGSQTR